MSKPKPKPKSPKYQAGSQTQRPVLEPQLVFCGTSRSVENARVALSTAKTIFMDCGGFNLGVRGGTLSILSLGVIPLNTIQYLHIYLIDVAHLSLVDLQPIYDLLASSYATKVVWDGRMDYSALYHEYGVRMQNVVDLQLVDILSRESRDTPAEHLKRFNNYVHPELLRSTDGKKRYAKLHRLNSLVSAVREHKPIGHRQFEKVKAGRRPRNSTSPLSEAYIKYSAVDIEMIAALFLNFISNMYIPLLAGFSFKEKSARYVAFWADRQPLTTETNHYARNAFLPLEAVDDSSGEQKHKCEKCKRFLTKASFPLLEFALPDTQFSCAVCIAVAENSSYWEAARARPKRGRSTSKS
ncbi:hypothetical protein BDY19DRAFT_990374 [Irpex rosettiformis]|uniref:Uncharacterized protein n=1 Tax=Irpex rosettiformis TaxID=378272 RepID=A0ACB8UEA7_9APHY|nr:hypothetical protein BDY19DRAFT_990374 [Irpex rosettiformis]